MSDPKNVIDAFVSERDALRARIQDLEANIIEADAAFTTDHQPEPIEVAELALVRMCHEGRAAMDRVNELEAAQRWIPVGERLPDEIGWYPVWLNTPRGKLTLQEDVYWAPGWPFIDDGETVVYWHHPLPEPPAKAAKP
jgi:hypothetical protein